MESMKPDAENTAPRDNKREGGGGGSAFSPIAEAVVKKCTENTPPSSKLSIKRAVSLMWDSVELGETGSVPVTQETRVFSGPTTVFIARQARFPMKDCE